jgi:hypothetical protein
MTGTVTINSIVGTPNFNVWISNGCLDTDVSVFIDTISNSDIPYTFNVPVAYQNSAFCVKIYDNTDCKICECFGFGPSPTPSMTPSVTPSITITSTPTPTPTPSGECLTPTYYHGSFTGNGFTQTVTYTLSPTLYNNRAQWTSSSNGTIRWNGYRWEISNWNLAGVTYYNGNVSTLYAPDSVNWVYQGCAKGFTCAVTMTTEGCGVPPTPTPSSTSVSQTPTPTPTLTPTSSETRPIVSQTPTTTPTPTSTSTPLPTLTPYPETCNCVRYVISGGTGSYSVKSAYCYDNVMYWTTLPEGGYYSVCACEGSLEVVGNITYTVLNLGNDTCLR